MDAHASRSERYAREFNGLPAGVTHGQLMAAFKRAAPHMAGINGNVVHALDTLFAWTQAGDWKPGNEPIVWPSNATISLKIGVGLRQVQYRLARLTALGLIAHRDSPNGNRTGVRRADGSVIYAYGISLAPVGRRYAEFLQIAEAGEATEARLKMLRRRLSCAYRNIRVLAQTVVDQRIGSIDADSDLHLAELAVREVTSTRDEQLLTRCVDQIETCATRLHSDVDVALNAEEPPSDAGESAPSGEESCMPITTTKQPLIAKASYRSSLAKKSRQYDVRIAQPQTTVEADLEQHQINPAFIARIAPELCPELSLVRLGWGEIIVIAERLAEQNGIKRHVWHEACRLMGQKGAAASVIATIHKHLYGDVRRPGAYLRGMSQRAALGELNLGRTFHGFKDTARSTSMQAIYGDATPSLGQLAFEAVHRSRRVPDRPTNS